MVCLTAAAYEWSGRPLALLVASGCLFTLGLAAEGIHPAKAAHVLLVARWQMYRAARETRRAQAQAT